MAVPNTMQDLATLASSNSPAGSEAIGNSLDNYLRAHAAIVRSTYALASSTIAAASTTDIATADAESVQITGTATITSLGTGFNGCRRELRFSGVCTLVHSANIVLPGAVNVTTAAGDVIAFRCTGSGVWALVSRAKPAITSSDVTTGLGYTPLNKAGDTVLGTFHTLAQGIGPVIGFRDTTNTVTRFYQNHNDSVWAVNVADDTGAFRATAIAVTRTAGRVGIQNTTPDAYNSTANTAVVGSGTGSHGITVVSGAASFGGIHFADGTVGDQSYRGIVYYDHSLDEMSLWTAATKRLSINSTGDMAAGGGLTLGGGKKLSKITVSSAAPGALVDGELYLRF